MYFLTSLPLPIPFDPLSLPLNFSTCFFLSFFIIVTNIHNQFGAKLNIHHSSATPMKTHYHFFLSFSPGPPANHLIVVCTNHQYQQPLITTPTTNCQTPITNHKCHQSSMTNHQSQIKPITSVIIHHPS